MYPGAYFILSTTRHLGPLARRRIRAKPHGHAGGRVAVRPRLRKPSRRTTWSSPRPAHRQADSEPPTGQPRTSSPWRRQSCRAQNRTRRSSSAVEPPDPRSPSSPLPDQLAQRLGAAARSSRATLTLSASCRRTELGSRSGQSLRRRVRLPFLMKAPGSCSRPRQLLPQRGRLPTSWRADAADGCAGGRVGSPHPGLRLVRQRQLRLAQDPAEGCRSSVLLGVKVGQATLEHLQATVKTALHGARTNVQGDGGLRFRQAQVVPANDR